MSVRTHGPRAAHAPPGRLRRGGGLPRRDAGLGARHHHAADHARALVGGGRATRRWAASASSDFVAYFLATFIVRQLTGAWVAWEMNFEVRTGTLAMRLLRPIHPMVAYAVENLAAMPLRLVVALPVAVARAGPRRREPAAARPAALGRLGCCRCSAAGSSPSSPTSSSARLALWTGSSVKVMDVWLGALHGLQRVPHPGGALPAGDPGHHRGPGSRSATRSASRSS